MKLKIVKQWTCCSLTHCRIKSTTKIGNLTRQGKSSMAKDGYCKRFVNTRLDN